MVNITVNGERRSLARECNVRDLLAELKLPAAERGIAVAVNGEVVRRSEWPQVVLRQDDRIEIVHATQGG